MTFCARYCLFFTNEVLALVYKEREKSILWVYLIYTKAYKYVFNVTDLSEQIFAVFALNLG